MDKEKKMSSYKKKTNLAQFTEVRRVIGQKKGREARESKAINDGLTVTQRITKRIKDAANGCWWVEQYIRGSISYAQSQSDRLKGIDDE